MAKQSETVAQALEVINVTAEAAAEQDVQELHWLVRITGNAEVLSKLEDELMTVIQKYEEQIVTGSVEEVEESSSS